MLQSRQGAVYARAKHQGSSPKDTDLVYHKLLAQCCNSLWESLAYIIEKNQKFLKDWWEYQMRVSAHGEKSLLYMMTSYI